MAAVLFMYKVVLVPDVMSPANNAPLASFVCWKATDIANVRLASVN